MQGYFRDKIQK